MIMDALLPKNTSPKDYQEFDILCGKDKTFAKHPGNQIFRERIAAMKEPYQAAGSKHAKMKITKEIVAFMQTRYGARFLKISKNKQWEEINDQAARDKVSHALRFAANYARSASSVSSGNSSSSNNKAPATTTAVSKAPRRVSCDDKERRHSIQAISRRVRGRGSMDVSTHSYNRRASAPSALMMMSGDSSSSMDTPTAEVVIDDLYRRQQTILQSMHSARMHNEEAVMPHAISAASMIAEQQQAPQREFNTLRSEDLDEIFQEPLISEWDTVERLAA